VVIDMKLEEAKDLYSDEWLAFRTFEDGDNPEGEVILHNKNRKSFDRELMKLKPTDVYITFAGPLIPEGYAVMF
jgi:hypothetical protein